ncbi:unnamed protein product [Urochloa humidicola]
MASLSYFPHFMELLIRLSPVTNTKQSYGPSLHPRLNRRFSKARRHQLALAQRGHRIKQKNSLGCPVGALKISNIRAPVKTRSPHYGKHGRNGDQQGSNRSLRRPIRFHLQATAATSAMGILSSLSKHLPPLQSARLRILTKIPTKFKFVNSGTIEGS